MKRLAALLLTTLLWPGVASADPPTLKYVPAPDRSYTYEDPHPWPTLPWLILQALPSPEVAFGTFRRFHDEPTADKELQTAFGLRWQVTPVLWSWGVHRKVNRFRWFVVDPLARVSGSLELDATFEYLWGHVDRMLVRPGVRANFPLAQRGEYLSVAFGTSIYRYDDTTRVAYDAGIYTLYGMLGAQITVAPTHAPLAAIATLRLRYF